MKPLDLSGSDRHSEQSLALWQYSTWYHGSNVSHVASSSLRTSLALCARQPDVLG